MCVNWVICFHIVVHYLTFRLQQIIAEQIEFLIPKILLNHRLPSVPFWIMHRYFMDQVWYWVRNLIFIFNIDKIFKLVQSYILSLENIFITLHFHARKIQIKNDFKTFYQALSISSDWDSFLSKEYQ